MTVPFVRNEGPGFARDLLTLTKPEILVMSMLTAAAAAAIAPGNVGWVRASLAVLGTGLCVGSANVLNMCWERDSDRTMLRTRKRPLPAGRMRPVVALLFGLFLGAMSLLVLYGAAGVLTACLGALGLATYVLVYTPLKKVTPHALLVGAAAGALPPLMGWSAVSGRFGSGGIALFLLLLFWQVPHFLAIALFRQDDYARAGIRAMPLVWGERITRVYIRAGTVLVVASSLLLVPLAGVGAPFLLFAAPAGAWFLSVSWGSPSPLVADSWARNLFRVSLIYLPTLACGAFVDSLIKAVGGV